MGTDAHPRPGRCLVWALSFGALICGQIPVSANPSDAQIVRGSVRIDASTAGYLKILQDSDKAIIDWGSFSIAPGETTQFIQPSQLSAALNRVRGADPSFLEGALKANGRVFLLNPNGVVVGRSGSIDVGGFVASTLDLDNDNFWNGGDLEFRGNSQAAVVNLGTIRASDGDVFLIGASVRNEGTLRAPKGTVGLAAGNDVLIASAGNERVFVRGASGGRKDTGVDNRGVIAANTAELKAHGGNHYALAIRNEGRVAATGVTRSGGQILLRANGGRIESRGTLTARRIGGQGGSIQLQAGEAEAGAESRVVVSGIVDASATVGDGGDITMTATDMVVDPGTLVTTAGAGVGNGGQALLIAENRLDFHGLVSAEAGELGGNGGFIDLSGKRELYVDDLSRQVRLSAPMGQAGTLLLDPIDVSITTGVGGGVSGTSITMGAINDFLTNTGSLVINTTGVGGSGDITMAASSAISWATGNSLTLEADRDFIMNGGASISATGTGAFSVTAARAIGLAAGASITTTHGNLSLSANQQALPTAGNFVGIDVNNAVVQVTGTGSLTVAGRGGDGPENFQVGVQVRGGGDIIGGPSGPAWITGTGGNSIGLGNRGVSLNGTGSTIRSSGGSLLVEGVGGGAGAGASNSGVDVSSGGVITNTGTDVGATVTVRGTGGNLGGPNANHGVAVTQPGGTSITSAGGSVLVEGTAGGGLAGSYNAGVFVYNGSSITSAGTGPGATVTVVGSGGDPARTGTFNPGVWLDGTNARIASSGGAIGVTGIGSSLSEGVRLENNGAFVSGGNANLTVTTDSLYLDTATMNSGTETTTILNRTAGTLIQLGGADVLTGSPLTLGLTDGELDGITAGLLQIGNGSSGAITVSNAITHGNPLSLSTGAGITMSQAITMAPDQNLTVNALGTIHLNAANADLSTSGTGAISLTTERNLLLASGSSVRTVNGSLSLSANQQPVATSGAFAGIEINGATVETTGSGILNVFGRGGNSGGGNIGLNVTGGGQVIGGTSAISLITGLGGNSTGSSNIGVQVTGADSLISSNGDNVVIQGIGGGTGATSGSNSGVLVISGGTITSGVGSGVSVTGTGGGGEGINNKGVWISQATTAGTITSGGGYVDVVGTGGGAGGSTNNQGVDVAGSATVLSTGGGALTVTGTGGANTLTEAIRFSGAVSTTGNQAITLIADSFSSSGGTIDSGTGTTTIRTLTNGRAIDLGGADVAGTTLGLTDAELDRITAGTLEIGNSDSGSVTVSAAISHGNSLSITAGGGLAVNQSLAMATGKDLRLTSDTLALGAALSGTGNLVIAPLTAATSIGLGDGATGTLNLDFAELSQVSNGFAAIEYGDAATGEIDFGMNAVFVDPSKFTGSNFQVNHSIAGQGDASLHFAGTPGATTYLAANLFATGAPITIDSDVVLQADALIDTTGPGVVSSGGNVSISGTVEGSGSARSFGITAGSGGIIDLDGAVGAGNLIGNVSFNAAELNLAGALTSQGTISLSADAMALGGSISGSSTLAISPQTVSASVGIGGEPGTLNLSTTELNLLQDGFSAIEIGRGDGTGTIRIGAVTFQDPVTITSPDGALFVNGQITGAGDATVTLYGNGLSGDPTTLTAPIVTNGNEVTIFDSVLLGAANLSIDTTGGGSFSGANVSITGNVDADDALNQRDFTIDAGSGTILMYQSIGSSQALQDLTLEAGLITLQGPVSALGSLSFLTDAIEVGGILSSPGVLSIVPRTDSTTVGIGNTVLGDLHLDDDELLRFNDGFSSILIGSPTGTGELSIGSVTFQDPVTLQSPGGAISLLGLLTGAGNASVHLIGNGPASPAISLHGAIETHGNAVTIDDDVILHHPILGPGKTIDTTASGLVPTGGDVTITGSVNGDGQPFRNFVIDAGTTGAMEINGLVGTTGALHEIEFSASSLTLSMGAQATGNIDLLSDTLVLDPGATVSTIAELTIAPRTSGRSIGIGGAAGDLALDTATLDLLSGGAIFIGNASTGAITMNAATFSDPVTFTGASIQVDELLQGLGDAGLTFTSTDPVRLGADVGTSGNPITFNGDVELLSSVTLNTTEWEVETGADVSFLGGIDGAFAPADLTIRAGTQGIVDVFQALGSGGMLQNLDITAGELRLNGAVNAQGNLTLLTDHLLLGGNVTGAPGSSILTIAPQTATRSMTIGGNPGAASDLEIDAGELARLNDGFLSIEFGDNLTGTIDLQSGTFSDPVTFTGTGIAVNAALLGTGNAAMTFASPTDLAANLETEGNSITFEDGVTLLGDILIDTTANGSAPNGAGVSALSTIGGSGSARSLTVRAGDVGLIELNGAVGASNLIQNLDLQAGAITLGSTVRAQGDIDLLTDSLALGGNLNGAAGGTSHLRIVPRTASRSIGIGGAAGDLNLSAIEVDYLQNGFASITIGDTLGGSGAITTQAISFEDPLTLAAPFGSIAINGQLTGAGNASITLAGATTLGAPIVTGGNPVTFQNSVTLAAANTLIDSSNGGGSTGGADLTFNGNVNADAAGNLRDFVLVAGTGGIIQMDSAIGNAQAVRDIEFRSSALNLGSTATAQRDIQFLTDEISIGGAISAPGDLVIAPQTAGGSMGIGNGAAGTLQIDSLELGRLSDGFASIALGNGSTGALTLTATTFLDPVTFTGSPIHVDGQISGDGNAALTFAGPANLGANVVTQGNFIRFEDPLRLLTNILLDTTNGGAAPSGAYITALDTVDGTGAPRSLTIQTGTAGDITFQGQAGATGNLNEAQLTGRSFTATAPFQTVGPFTAAMTNGFTLSGAAADLSTAGAAITIDADSDDDAIGSVTIQAGSIASNGADISLTAADLSLTGTVNAGLAEVAVRHSRPDGAIYLGPAVPGPGMSVDNLELNRITAATIQIGELTDGPIRVTEPILLTTPATNVSLLAAEQISIEGDLRTTGDLRMETALGVTTTGDRILTAKSVTAQADVTAQGKLTIVTEGTLDLAQSTAMGANALTVTAGGTVDLRRVTGSNIEVKGLATADTVLLSHVPARLVVDGGAGTDTVTFASAGAPVTTAAPSYTRVENLIGSGFADTLIGSTGNDIFSITQNNRGSVSYISTAGTRVSMGFQSFETLRGGAGNDRFNFTNQATLSGQVFGDAHTTGDTLFIDDSNLSSDETYIITANSVQRNPVYTFNGVEALVLHAGSGEDQVQTTFHPFTQAINGGPGEDTLEIPAAVNTNTPITQVGSGNVTYAQVEKVIGQNGPVDTGNILQNTANNVNPLAQNNSGNPNNDVIDNFGAAADVGNVAGGPGGGVGGVGGAAAVGIAGQVAQALGALPDANGAPTADFAVTPFNSGGNVGAISLAGGVISLQGQTEINQNVTVSSEMELNAAMGKGETATADGGDGPVGVAGEEVAAPDTEQTLGQGTDIMAEGELLGALGENVSVKPGDGTVALGLSGPPPLPAVQQEITNQGRPESFSDLSQAIGGDGTARTGPGAGIVDLQLNGTDPGAAGGANLGENLNALTQTELEAALNGL